jgi:hypothetical protein
LMPGADRAPFAGRLSTVLRVNVIAAAQLTRARAPLPQEAPQALRSSRSIPGGPTGEAMPRRRRDGSAGARAGRRVGEVDDVGDGRSRPAVQPMRRRTHLGDDPAICVAGRFVPLYQTVDRRSETAEWPDSRCSSAARVERPGWFI